MEYRDLTLEATDGVWLVTLNRPEMLNALGPRLVYEIIDVIDTAEWDDTCKVLLFTGAGRAFSSGADLNPAGAAEGAELREAKSHRRMTSAPWGHFGVLFKKIDNFSKPIIAAVNGVASGAALSLVLASDIRIASTDASFISVFIRRGISPDTGTTFMLPKMIGPGRATEMMLTGDKVSAEDADRWGLVNRTVAPEELMPEAKGLAARIAKGPSLTIELAKRLIVDEVRSGYTEALQREGWASSIVRDSDDIKEGMQSFLEKREPRWKGR